MRLRKYLQNPYRGKLLIFSCRIKPALDRCHTNLHVELVLNFLCGITTALDKCYTNLYVALVLTAGILFELLLSPLCIFI